MVAVQWPVPLSTPLRVVSHTVSDVPKLVRKARQSLPWQYKNLTTEGNTGGGGSAPSRSKAWSLGLTSCQIIDITERDIKVPVREMEVIDSVITIDDDISQESVSQRGLHKRTHTHNY